jgi:hypothetical protein
MPQNLELERQVITRFFEKSKRDRYLHFVTSPKNRKKLLADLHSGQVFRGNTLERVTGIEEQVIQQALSQQGITSHTCYVISENVALDTQTFLLPEALRQVVGGRMGCWHHPRVWGGRGNFCGAGWLAQPLHQQVPVVSPVK